MPKFIINSTLTFSILLSLSITSTLHAAEADYVASTCEGVIEYQLPDRTRVDCLTDNYAIEYDWQHKWAEAIGQSLYYSAMTGKKPAIRLICKNKNCKRYSDKIEKVKETFELDIQVELIRD